MSEKSTATQTALMHTSLKLVEPQTLFARIEKIYDSIGRRAFELFESNGRVFGRDLDDWLKAEAELLHPVHVHIDETGQAFTVKAEVPGFSAKELEVSVEPRRVMISGKRESKEKRKKGETIYTERCSDELLRGIELPAEVNASKATATLKDGVLELELPKIAKAQPIRIEPKVA